MLERKRNLRSRVWAQRAANDDQGEKKAVHKWTLGAQTRSGISYESRRDNSKGTTDTPAEEFSDGLDLGVIHGILGLKVGKLAGSEIAVEKHQKILTLSA